MLARRASSSFSCNKQARYSQPQEHSRAPQGKQGCAGFWAAALPRTSPPGTQLQGAQGAQARGSTALVGCSSMALWARHQVGPAVLVPSAVYVTPARGARVTKDRVER